MNRDELAEKYLTGQLDPAVQDEFEVHILDCAPCLRQVEAVQTLRDQLADRAAQIRAFSQIERSPFRWRWAAVAAFGLVVCALGLVEFRRMKTQQSAKLLPPPASAQSATSSNGAGSSSNPSRAPSASIDNLPVNGRYYINFTMTDSHVARDKAPSTGSAPSSGLNIKGQRARSNVVTVDGADATDNSVNGIRTPESQIAASSSVSPVRSPLADATSDETAKELFRLGTVQAPPYTFSGFASSNTHDAETDAGGLAGTPKKSPINQARPFFRDAMNAYVDQRYSDASDLLEKAAQAEPNAPDIDFYLGVCRLLQGKPADSVAPLKSSLSGETSPWAQSAHFYLAKAYIQTGDLAQAETQLQAAADMPGHLKAEAASELARLQTVRAETQQNNPGEAKP